MDGMISAPSASVQQEVKMPWLWLIIGGCFEVGFTTSLRFVDGFRNVPWTIAFLVSVGISMTLLEIASRQIPMGTAYAVWGGIGAVGTVAVGLLWFGEPASLVRVLLILAIVAAIAALRFAA
jgi:quaternary ammonium compound-resistance protein SugE